jgi:hypothetical protein
MSLYKPYNPNPARNRVGDCTVRAICKATGQEWNRVFAALSAYGFAFKDMPSANYVWGAYLEDNGFAQHLIDKRGKRLYTVEDFCRDHPEGTYILAIEGHVVCVAEGYYYDSWDSGQEIPIFYWTRGGKIADP